MLRGVCDDTADREGNVITQGEDLIAPFFYSSMGDALCVCLLFTWMTTQDLLSTVQIEDGLDM